MQAKIGDYSTGYQTVFLLIAMVCDWAGRPARGAGTLIPSAQRLVWAAKQPLGNAALGALFA